MPPFTNSVKIEVNYTLTKKHRYEENGYTDKLITSEDGTDGSIDAEKIEAIARKKILGEK